MPLPAEPPRDDAGPSETARPSTVARAKETYASARTRVEETLDTLEKQRPERPWVDLAFRVYERDRDRGGGLLAGALSYRFFFWLLPFVLVLVGGLGFLASASSSAPQDVARTAGIVGFAAQSISQAAADAEHLRIWAVLVGLPALYLASLSFVKALMVTHALMWGVPNHRLQRKLVAAGTMTGVLVLTMLSLLFEGWLRSKTAGPGLFAAMVFMVVVGGLWLFVAYHMPRPPDSTWRDLVPAAVAVAVGLQAVHLVTVYYISRKVASASSSYGGLGAAAGILLGLFFIARVVVVGVGISAEMWATKHPTPVGRHAHLAPDDDSIDLDAADGSRFRDAVQR